MWSHSAVITALGVAQRSCTIKKSCCDRDMCIFSFMASSLYLCPHFPAIVSLLCVLTAMALTHHVRAGPKPAAPTCLSSDEASEVRQRAWLGSAAQLRRVPSGESRKRETRPASVKMGSLKRVASTSALSHVVLISSSFFILLYCGCHSFGTSPDRLFHSQTAGAS